MRNIPNCNVSRLISYDGKKYPSYRQLILENMSPGLNYDAVNRRITNGWDIHDALTIELGNRNPSTKGKHEYKGKFYDTKRELIVDNMHPSLTYSAVCSRISSNWSLDDALSFKRGSSNPSKPLYEYNGRFYKTIREMVEDNKHPSMSYIGIISRIDLGWSLDEAMNTPKGIPRSLVT